MSMDHALQLAAQGYRVIPVKDKTPQIKEWPQRATTDPDEVRSLWADRNHDVGIATGGGLVVVDLDVKNGRDGVQALTEWADANDVKWSVTTSTLSGKHLYFKTSEQYPNQVDMLKGVDVRAEGGFVVAYGDVPPLADLPILPGPLARLIGRKDADDTAAERTITPAGVRAAVEAELFKVELAPEGQRNHVLNAAAYNLGQLVGDHLDTDEVRGQLIEAALNAGLDHHEAHTTVESGLTAGMANPRTVAEDKPEPGAWSPVNFTELRANGLRPVQPTLLARTDGLCLLYPGLTHSISGESGSGKSWLAQWATAEALHAGHRALYLDYESSAAEVAQRLLILGCSWDQIESSFVYVNPDAAPTGAEFEALLAEPYGLAVVDGVTEALGLSGIAGDNLTNSNDAVTRWHKMLPKRIAVETGAAVVQVDHVTKSKDGRGGYAIGGQAKRASITGASYIVNTIESFGRGRSGAFELFVSKDRPGAVLASHEGSESATGKHVAVVEVDCTDDSVRLTLKPEGQTINTALESAKTRVAAFLDGLPEAHKGASRNMVRKEVSGGQAVIDQALKELVGSGHVIREPVGQAVYHRLVRPYFEGEGLL